MLLCHTIDVADSASQGYEWNYYITVKYGRIIIKVMRARPERHKLEELVTYDLDKYLLVIKPKFREYFASGIDATLPRVFELEW
jgi:hypothetical protein